MFINSLFHCTNRELSLLFSITGAPLSTSNRNGTSSIAVPSTPPTTAAKKDDKAESVGEPISRFAEGATNRSSTPTAATANSMLLLQQQPHNYLHHHHQVSNYSSLYIIHKQIIILKYSKIFAPGESFVSYTLPHLTSPSQVISGVVRGIAQIFMAPIHYGEVSLLLGHIYLLVLNSRSERVL